MPELRLGGIALLVSVTFAGCATEKKQVEATSEIIYEEAVDAGPAEPTDPFAGCEAKQQQTATILSCGDVTGAFIPISRAFSPAAVEQNLKTYEGSFPAEATRERFTQTFGGTDASGARVYQESPVSSFRAEMVILPMAANATWILSCIVRGSTNWDRCQKITAEMAQNGVPERVPGAPPPPTIPGVSDGGMDDGGMGMEDMDAGMRGMEEDAGTRRRATDAGVRRRTRDGGMR
jgi:hypothetical protein